MKHGYSQHAQLLLTASLLLLISAMNAASCRLSLIVTPSSSGFRSKPKLLKDGIKHGSQLRRHLVFTARCCSNM